MGYYEPGPDSAAGRDEKPAKKIVAILLFQGGLAAVGLLLPSSVGVGQRVRIVLLTVVAQPRTRAPLERACCRCPIRDEAGGGSYSPAWSSVLAYGRGLGTRRRPR